ncbi:dgkA [Mytilus coruscus]|uniref:DgkA n=1 Tax=Mytilus coruscus TaxID=42192 RepID=A0A6J8D2W9_MYTCO|nr:dgkA [Mytilus coruscus]
MVERLRDLYDEYQLTGDSTATWEAYSLELCLEKMLWGRPASRLSNKLAVEIGPGAISLMNCRTGQFGFLALEPWIYRARPPPLKIRFKSSIAISKVYIFYGFHNILDSPCESLRKEFIKRFLEDSFVSKSVIPGSCDDFFQHLQGQPNSPYKGVSIGKMSREDVAMRLTLMASPRASKVFMRIIEFLTLADLQLQDVLLSAVVCQLSKYRTYALYTPCKSIYNAIITNTRENRFVLRWDTQNSPPIPFQLPKATATATTAEKPEVENPKPAEECEPYTRCRGG